MKPLAVALIVAGPMLAAAIAYVLDIAWGMLAYTSYYLLLSLLTAFSIGVLWRVTLQKYGLFAGLITLLIMITPLYLPAPPTRLLVAAMLSVSVGADCNSIEPAVHAHFDGSGYEMPEITSRSVQGFERIHVSLYTVERGNCSAIVFLCRNGKVTDRWFSPD